MKKWVTGILFITLAFVLIGCFADKNSVPFSAETDEAVQYMTLRVGMFFPEVPERDLTLVENEISKITREKIGVEVDLFNDATTGDIIGRTMNGYEQLDIVTISKYTLYEHYLNGNLLNLGNLLEQYGKNLIDEIGIKAIEACKIGDCIYGIPSKRTYAYGADSYVLRKDILKKYQIAPEDIRSYDDLERVFSIVKEKEQDLAIVAPMRGTMLSNQYYSDAVYGVYMLGVHLNYGKEKKLINIFESKEYRDALYRVREWYQKGYIDGNFLGQQENIMEKAARGELFCYATKWEPGMLDSGSCKENDEWICVQLGEDAIGYNNIPMYLYCISSNTISEEKSMQLLSLLFTDADIVNLLTYGVEGIHYVKTSDGHVTNVASSEENVFRGAEWSKPNQALAYVWEGNPLTLWEEKEEYNENSIHAYDLGFNFDITPVATQYFTLEQIYLKYRDILENGLVDPDEGLEMLNREMYENGISEVIEEMQCQFDKWKNSYIYK